MVVLVTASTGFLGSRVARALAHAGHTLVLGVHRAEPADLPGRVLTLDLERERDVATWRARLRDVDVVVNTAGILRERAGRTFAGLHAEGPRALFAACAESGVRQVIQLSALGADDQAKSRYHTSKREADRFLAGLPIASVILQPSLVYGPGGASARLFEAIATLPLLALPGGGRQRVQPVRVDDLVEAVTLLVGRDTPPGTTLAVVGPEAVAFVDYLQRLRMAMGRARASVVAVPMPLARSGAALAGRIPGVLFDREALDMLERGNTADAAPLRTVLGREPRAIDTFVDREHAGAVYARAVLAWQLPILRLAIAIVWIWTGLVSLGLYPVDESYALLARLRIEGALATVLLYGAALVDLALGIATLALRDRRWVWRAQIAVMLGYTLVISVWLPEWWLHPYGPIVKNLPLIAATWLVATIEARERRA